MYGVMLTVVCCPRLRTRARYNFVAAAAAAAVIVPPYLLHHSIFVDIICSNLAWPPTGKKDLLESVSA